jgi:CRP-like cAMP-binding protein
MTKEQARAQVLNLAVLAGLSSHLREKMADTFLTVASPQIVAANTTLFKKGQTSNDEGFVLLDGEVSVLKDGAPEIIAPAPDILGEIGHLSHTKQRSATVVAACELKILRFKWSALISTALQLLTAEEAQQFTSALQEYAWRHFTE